MSGGKNGLALLYISIKDLSSFSSDGSAFPSPKGAAQG